MSTRDPVPWFENDECYNPGIHNINAAVAYRHAHPLDVQLPPPHPELVKYMLTPQRVIESAKKAYDSLKDEFDVKSVPIKLATGRGRKRGAADTEDNGDIDFDDFL